MTDDELKELERLADAATPGAWSYYADPDNRHTGHQIYRVVSYETQKRWWSYKTSAEPPYLATTYADDINGTPDLALANGKFIAAVNPQAVKALIAEVRRLRLLAELCECPWADD